MCLERYERSALSAPAPVLGVSASFLASVPHIRLLGGVILLSRQGFGDSLLDVAGGLTEVI